MDVSALAGKVAIAAGPWAVALSLLLGLLVAFSKEIIVTGKARDRLAAAYEAQILRIREDHAAENARLAALNEGRLGESLKREQDWRAAFERSEERADLLAGQVEKLMVYAQTTDQFLRALPRGGGR